MAKTNLFRTPIVLTFLIKKIILLKISLHFYMRTLTYFRNMIDKLLCNICCPHDNYSFDRNISAPNTDPLSKDICYFDW